MNISYAVVLSFTALISVVVAQIVWRRRNAPGAFGLLLYSLGMFVWSSTYAVRWLVNATALQYIWLDATYLGLVIGLYGLVIFTLQVTNHQNLLTPRNLLLLAIEPVLITIILWTDKYHGWFYAGLRTTGTILNGGAWFWFNIIYSYLVILVMAGLIFREFMRASHLYRRQLGAVLIGILVPVFGNLLSFTRILPFSNLDYTPFFFTITGLVFTFAFFRYGLMDILPVAYDKLFESLPDGVLVLDSQRRLVEINPAARVMLGITPNQIGSPAKTVLARWPGLEKAIFSGVESQSEIHVSQESPCDIEVRVMPLFKKLQDESGSLVLLRDITERIQMEARLKQMSIHDALTGLYNRAFFEEELARLERSRQYPVSLLVADVDNLKMVNDNLGHSAGDEILIRTAAVLEQAFRAEDIITRIGGDEFVVILPNTGTQSAQAVLQRLQAVLDENNLAFPNNRLGISVGISTADVGTSLTEAFKKADADMYIQKRSRHAGADQRV